MEIENKPNQDQAEREFLEAYDEFSEKILRHVHFRVADPDTAEEILSETFLKTWKYLSEGHRIDNLKSFLYRVANNLIIDHYRSKKRLDLSLDEAIAVETPAADDPEEKLDVKLATEALEEALERLPEAYRQMLTYRYLDELSVAEISQVTGKSAVNVYVTIHRAIKLLKGQLKPEMENKK